MLSEVGVSISSSELLIGPTDINRRVGESNIIIMCPTFKPVAPIWRVNNYTYGASSLPSPFKPAYDNLFIPLVQLTMNQSTFQSYVPTGTSLKVLPSSVGILTLDSGNLMQLRSTQIDDPRLALNHWRLHFYSENLTLSWLYSNDSAGDDEVCSFSDAIFHIQGWQCLDRVISSFVWQQNVTNVTEISIPCTNLTHNNNSVLSI